MIYIMNSAVMPAGNYGTYRYSPATVEDLAIVMRLTRRVTDPGTKGAPVSADPADWEFAWVAYER